MELAPILSQLPPASWQVAQMVVFDWYDSPLEGVCELAEPACTFYFELLAEPYRMQQEREERLFWLSPLPAGTVREVLAALSDLGPPQRPCWIPRWRFRDPAGQAVAEARLQALIEGRPAPEIILQAIHLTHFLRWWVMR